MCLVWQASDHGTAPRRMRRATLLGPARTCRSRAIVALLAAAAADRRSGSWSATWPSTAPLAEAVDIGQLRPADDLSTTARRTFCRRRSRRCRPRSNAGPPAPAADEQTAAGVAPTERVKVANTGGVGAILRADPPKGRQVAALRDGTLLQVLEHRQVDDGSDWLRVETPDGAEGWVLLPAGRAADAVTALSCQLRSGR